MTEPADNLEYGTVIKDGDLFRLYTRDGRGAKFDGDATEVTRYCESRDGIHWTKPKLGLYEIDGSKENNVILHEPPFCHNFSPFLDTRPGVPADERFKALAGTVKSGLVAFVSGDGIRWRKLRPEPVITLHEGIRVRFAERLVLVGERRALRLLLPALPRQETAFRLPHDVAGLPDLDRAGAAEAELPRRAPLHDADASLLPRPAHLHRHADAVSSGPRRKHRHPVHDSPRRRPLRPHVPRSVHPPGPRSGALGQPLELCGANVVPTGPTEMSIYTTPFRRFALRTDGFASVHAGADAGEMRDPPAAIRRQELVINYSTSAGGSLRVEVQDAAANRSRLHAGRLRALVGDAIEQPPAWRREKAGPTRDLANLAGRPVRLRFELVDADLYSIQFR